MQEVCRKQESVLFQIRLGGGKMRGLRVGETMLCGALTIVKRKTGYYRILFPDRTLFSDIKFKSLPDAQDHAIRLQTREV